MGRKMKIDGPEGLRRAVKAYFASISRHVRLKDALGQPVTLDDGSPCTVREWLKPPSISGLCLFLGISRRTWSNYADAAKHKELAEIVEQVELTIMQYLEEELVTRDRPQGIIFNLQNNFAWRERAEIEAGPETRQALTMDQKLQMIAEAARSYSDEEAESLADG